MTRLGTSAADYDQYEQELLAAGLRVVFKRDLQFRRDLANPSDDVVKFVQMRIRHLANESEIRAAIDDIYSRPNMDVCVSKLAIFRK